MPNLTVKSFRPQKRKRATSTCYCLKDMASGGMIYLKILICSEFLYIHNSHEW
uniref:Uncharacterized protein n=1 Tax=Anguilla anguilla TaxID=7936 RepID=A0A0E9VDS9_ANGAN